MKRFLAWVFGKVPRVRAEAVLVEPEEWTDDDAEELKVFMAGRSGRKLRAMLWHEAAARAMSTRDRGAFERGNVAGQIETVRWLDRLAVPTRDVPRAAEDL